MATNMSSIGEVCNSLWKTFLTSLVGNHRAFGGLRVNSSSVKGWLINFPLFLLKGNAILLMTPKADCAVRHMSYVTCHMSCNTGHLSHDIITPKLLELGTWNFETVFTTPCVSWVTCHVSQVMCHMSCVTCHMLCVITKLTKNGGASQWKVCCQWGLPRLIFN